MKLLAVLAVLLSFGAFAAGELDEAQLIGTTDKPRATDYKCGEKMVFTLALKNAKEYPKDTYFVEWTRTGDDGKTEKGKLPLEKTPFVYTTSIDKPGFVRLRAVVADAKGRAYRKELHVDASTPEGKRALNRWERADKRVFFDGGAGAEPEKLQSVSEPKDFDEFWARRKARLAKVPLKAELVDLHLKGPANGYAVTIMCAGPRPCTGYMTIPKKPGKYPISVSFHGYGHSGNGKGHVIQSPTSGSATQIYFNFSPHGYELLREGEYYDEFYRSLMNGGRTFGFCKVQNQDPENSYFSGYTYRIMRALQYLKTRPEWDGKNLRVGGGSMGGLQSMWAAALDNDVTEANPSIPWCCNMGGQDTQGRHHDSWYIEETPALRYYDNVNLARRVSKKCKVNIIRAGLGDYCCPPSGIWMMWNNLPCEKTCRWVQGSTHGHVPPEGLGNQEYTLHESAK